MNRFLDFALGILLMTISYAATATPLEQTLDQRISGDRSGVCLAVARIGDETETAFRCAGAEATPRLDADSRMEIGSVSKAMQGVLLARLVEQGKLSLDEPLADLLPDPAQVPQSGDRPITLLDLLTHTSGLPRLPAELMEGMNPLDPYAALTEEQLLAALENAELSRAPGEAFEYSNFGAMLLSVAITRRTGKNLDELFRSELFEPLGMTRTGLTGPTVQGFNGSGIPVPNWDFPINMAGVGGVRSTLSDMTRWMEASLGRHDGLLKKAFERAPEILARVSGENIAWGWFHVSAGERGVVWHNGGTGGFASSVAFDPESNQAVAVLADAAMWESGGLDDLALHLLDASVPLKSPRPAANVPEDMNLADYAGAFDLYDGDEPFMGGFELKFFAENDTLMTQAGTAEMIQPPVALDAEGRDHFSQSALQLEIRFLRNDDGEVDALDFAQAGLSLRGQRRN